MAQSILEDVIEQLWPLCWVDSVANRVTIDLAMVEDDVSFTKPGVLFVSRASNRLAQ
jgi:hypothetical protein